MKRKKAALYNPYLDSMGGGERHTLSILQILQQEGYDISIFWDKPMNKEILNTLGIEFKKEPDYIGGVFPTTSLMKKLQILSKFDIFIYVTDGSYFFSSARRNYVFCMVPRKELYSVTLENPLNYFKTKNFKFISNSRFTQRNLKTWGVSSTIIYPYINDVFIDMKEETTKKDQVILTVGRFFRHLHSKRQDIAIKSFKKLVHENNLYKDFKLILAGGLREEDNDYFQELNNLAGSESNIIFKPNISYPELLELYRKADIYWHCAGYEVDPEKNPENVEHLGITPLEAMAAGCITFCYNAGGPREIINDAKNGFLFNSMEELINKTMSISKKEKDKEHIRAEAQRSVEKTYSYKVFKQRIREVFK